MVVENKETKIKVHFVNMQVDCLSNSLVAFQRKSIELKCISSCYFKTIFLRIGKQHFVIAIVRNDIHISMCNTYTQKSEVFFFSPTRSPSAAKPWENEFTTVTISQLDLSKLMRLQRLTHTTCLAPFKRVGFSQLGGTFLVQSSLCSPTQL